MGPEGRGDCTIGPEGPAPPRLPMEERFFIAERETTPAVAAEGRRRPRAPDGSGDAGGCFGPSPPPGHDVGVGIEEGEPPVGQFGLGVQLLLQGAQDRRGLFCGNKPCHHRKFSNKIFQIGSVRYSRRDIPTSPATCNLGGGRSHGRYALRLEVVMLTAKRPMKADPSKRPTLAPKTLGADPEPQPGCPAAVLDFCHRHLKCHPTLKRTSHNIFERRT